MKKDNKLVLSVNIKAHEFDQEFYKEAMNNLRGSLKTICGESVNEINPSEEDIDNFLEHILKNKNKDIKRIMGECKPSAIRKIAKVIKNSKLTNRDFASIEFVADA